MREVKFPFLFSLPRFLRWMLLRESRAPTDAIGYNLLVHVDDLLILVFFKKFSRGTRKVDLLLLRLLSKKIFLSLWELSQQQMCINTHRLYLII